MTQFTPADLREHLSLMASDASADGILADYIAAAEAYVTGYTRRDLDAEFPGGWPAPCLQAVRLMVGHWFLFREATTQGEVSRPIPFGVTALLAPYRDLS